VCVYVYVCVCVWPNKTTAELTAPFSILLSRVLLHRKLSQCYYYNIIIRLVIYSLPSLLIYSMEQSPS
jgi:hypothetical protein